MTARGPPKPPPSSGKAAPFGSLRKMKISLHLGAHKTATTYIQNRLRLNVETLARQGVRFVPLDDLRPKFSDIILAPGAKGSKVRRFVSRRKAGAFLKRQLSEQPDAGYPPVQRVILSEENFLGSPTRMVLTGELYPDIEQKLSRLWKHIKGHEIDLFLGIRHQAVFASSLFAEEMTQRTPYVYDADQFRAAWLASEPRWIDVVTRIRDFFPSSRLSVWNYDDFKRSERILLSRFCGSPTRMRFPQRCPPARLTLSQQTIDEMLRVQAAEGPQARKAAMPESRAKYPRRKGYPAFSLWTEEQVQAQGELFYRDLEAIAALGGNVRLARTKALKRKKT